MIYFLKASNNKYKTNHYQYNKTDINMLKIRNLFNCLKNHTHIDHRSRFESFILLQYFIQ